MSPQSWLGKTLCPPDCLVKSDIKAPSCAAIFRLGIIVLQCVRAGEVFCGLHVAHIRIICPVRDVTHVRKCTRPSPALPYYKRWEAGWGPGNKASTTWQKLAQVPVKRKNLYLNHICTTKKATPTNCRIWHLKAHITKYAMEKTLLDA